MEENKLRELQQSNREQTARFWRCPDDNDLASYVGHQLDGEKRKKFEAHVARCEPCLQAIGFLVASEEWPTAAPIPPHLLARARALSRTNTRADWRWGWAMTTAAAACVLLFVAFIFFRSGPERSVTPFNGDLVAQHQPTDAPSALPTASIQTSSPAPLPVKRPKETLASAPSVRSGTNELNLTVLSPREGALLRRDQLNFSWKPLAGAVSYEITVSTEDGGFVFAKTTNQLQHRPNDQQLPPGKYFAKVVAYMSDGRTARSRMVKFRVAGD